MTTVKGNGPEDRGARLRSARVDVAIGADVWFGCSDGRAGAGRGGGRSARAPLVRIGPGGGSGKAASWASSAEARGAAWMRPRAVGLRRGGDGDDGAAVVVLLREVP